MSASAGEDVELIKKSYVGVPLTKDQFNVIELPEGWKKYYVPGKTVKSGRVRFRNTTGRFTSTLKVRKPAKTPAATVKTPAATAKTPAATVKTPAATAKTPAATAKTPAATSKTPAATAKTPAATVKTPARTIRVADDKMKKLLLEELQHHSWATGTIIEKILNAYDTSTTDLEFQIAVRRAVEPAAIPSDSKMQIVAAAQSYFDHKQKLAMPARYSKKNSRRLYTPTVGSVAIPTGPNNNGIIKRIQTTPSKSTRRLLSGSTPKTQPFFENYAEQYFKISTISESTENPSEQNKCHEFIYYAGRLLQWFTVKLNENNKLRNILILLNISNKPLYTALTNILRVQFARINELQTSSQPGAFPGIPPCNAAKRIHEIFYQYIYEPLGSIQEKINKQSPVLLNIEAAFNYAHDQATNDLALQIMGRNAPGNR